MKKVRNQVEFQVSGRCALFSDPITRMGGEKMSYLVPTYQALKGIVESVYWKPSILWLIDEVRVMNPIRTEGKSILPIAYRKSTNTLSVYTYLVEPCYQVRAHFVPNPYRKESDLIEDGKNENKHYAIVRRMIERGGRRDIFLGTRECQGIVEPCVFGEGKGAYDERGEVNFGVMVHGFDYPDETGKEELSVRLWRAKMENGIIRFPKPSDCDESMRRFIRPMKAKTFGGKYCNFSPITEDVTLKNEGGDVYVVDAKTL